MAALRPLGGFVAAAAACRIPAWRVAASSRKTGSVCFSISATPQQRVSAVVVGAGASGVAVVGNLLDTLGPGATIGWVDPSFRGGRINARYREVPSNTKVSLFLAYAKALRSLDRVVQSTPQPNAITALEALPQESTCSLHFAGDMIQMLSDGLRRDSQVQCWDGMVTRADLDHEAGPEWSMEIDHGLSASRERLTAPIIVYCIGATPVTTQLPATPSRSPAQLDLDTALKPSQLSTTLAHERPLVVGVIGASHSAILVLMNLVRLSQTSHPHLRIQWFSRSPHLKYAEYKDGWILYDNTGLKGDAAAFAREQLEGENLLTSDAGKVITRVDCSGGPGQEAEAMASHLPECDFVIQAIGFKARALPTTEQDLAFDHETGRFTDRRTAQPVPGLFGAGIAFPERVVDPVGNVEHAVGFFKFMKFLKRVVPDWVETVKPTG
jgi:hypothetical protein